MKKYYLIDDCMRQLGHEDVYPLNTTDRNEAIYKALTIWFSLTGFEQNLTDQFYVARFDVDSDGDIIPESMEDDFTIKEA